MQGDQGLVQVAWLEKRQYQGSKPVKLGVCLSVEDQENDQNHFSVSLHYESNLVACSFRNFQ